MVKSNKSKQKPKTTNQQFISPKHKVDFTFLQESSRPFSYFKKEKSKIQDPSLVN